MDRFNCRSRLHPMNVYSVILEITKQELIQKPYTMVCSWGKYINSLKQYDQFKSPEAVQKFCRDSELISKTVLALLKANSNKSIQTLVRKQIQSKIGCSFRNYH